MENEYVNLKSHEKMKNEVNVSGGDFWHSRDYLSHDFHCCSAAPAAKTSKTHIRQKPYENIM